MKPTLMLIYAAIFLVSILPSVGCGREEAPIDTKGTPILNEKQIVDILHEYLISEDQDGIEVKPLKMGAERLSIGALFQSALTNAYAEALTETLNKSDLDDFDTNVVACDYCFPNPYPSRALKKVAQYTGDGLWLVSICGGEWLVNERTGQVTPRNEQATETLEGLFLTTPKTYYSTEFSYSIDYPPRYEIDDTDNKHILLTSGTSTIWTSVEILAYGFTDKSAEEVGQFMLDWNKESHAYFELSGNQTLERANCLTGWSLEYRYKHEPNDTLIWARNHLWVTKDGSLYSIIAKVYDEYGYFAIDELKYILAGFAVSENHVNSYISNMYGCSIELPSHWSIDDTEKSIVDAWSPNGKAVAVITVRDTYPQYEFNSESAIEKWIAAKVTGFRAKDAYFQLIRQGQMVSGENPIWVLEYYYRQQANDPLLWMKHQMYFARWREYDVAVQVGEEDLDCYLTDLSDILGSFVLTP